MIPERNIMRWREANFYLLNSGFRLLTFAVPSLKIAQFLEDFLGRHGSKLIDIRAVGGP